MNKTTIKSKNKNKISQLITLCLLIAFCSWIYINRMSLAYPFFSPQGKLNYLWNLDIKKLQNSNRLPKEFTSIQDIELRIVPVGTHWLKSMAIPIKKTTEGKNTLELEVLQWILDKKYGVTINYHLIDNKSGNTINEFGRTFELGSSSEIL